MKKNFSSAKWKRHLLRRSIYENKRHTKAWVDYKKKRKKERGLFVNFSSYTPSSFFLPVKAPFDFSIINNPDESLRFFKKAEKQLHDKTKTLLDLSQIKTLTPDAITLLVANVKSTEFHHRTIIKGNAPYDPDLRKLFVQSGFYDHVKSDMPKNVANSYLLHKRTFNKVEPDIAKEACMIGINHTFENQTICEPLYEILIECMSNTNNHADLNSKGIYDWWLFVYREPYTKVTSYTFLDLGVGIFESLPVLFYKKVLLNTKILSNINLVDDLTSGKIKSRTDQPERGRGLPQIFTNAQFPSIKNFKLISNDVFADFSTNYKRKLNKSFSGTLYYWELHPPKV